MSVQNGEDPPPPTTSGSDVTEVCDQAGAFVCPESVYYCEVLQRNAAWIVLSKGVRAAEQEALELGAAWMAALIEQIGRQARLFATLRGTAAVNYCDIKQALRAVCPSAYALLFAASVDPVAPRAPKQLPPKPEASPILTSDESWLVSELQEQREKAQMSSLQPPDSQQKNQVQKRPPHIPEYLPKYPLPHLYRRTEAPLSFEVDPQVAEFKRKYRKLELQLQLPQLQLPEPILETAQGPLNGGVAAGKGFWGAPTSQEIQQNQREAEDEDHQQQSDAAAPPSRRQRKAEAGAGDRPTHDLYLR